MTDVEEICTIANSKGLHARAAARFVKTAERFKSEVTVIKDEISVSGHSIMGLMMLAAAPGTPIKLCAKGDDALAVLDALADLIRRKFDEE